MKNRIERKRRLMENVSLGDGIYVQNKGLRSYRIK